MKLDEWAARVGQLPIQGSPNDLYAFGDWELGTYLVSRNGLFVVESTSRSTSRRVVGSFSSEADAVRFLYIDLGASWRANHGLRPISWDVAADSAILTVGPTAHHVEWPGGSAEFPLGVEGRNNALVFSHLATTSVDDIVAAYSSHTGEPLLEPDEGVAPLVVSLPPQRVPAAGSCVVDPAIIEGRAVVGLAIREKPRQPADSGWRIWGATGPSSERPLVRSFNLVADIEPRLVEIYSSPVGSTFRLIDGTFVAVEPTR